MTAGFGPNTYEPTMQEAERDEHENARCTWARPCPACERSNAR